MARIGQGKAGDARSVGERLGQNGQDLRRKAGAAGTGGARRAKERKGTDWQACRRRAYLARTGTAGIVGMLRPTQVGQREAGGIRHGGASS